MLDKMTEEEESQTVFFETEVVEQCRDDRCRHRPEGRGTSGEIAHPETVAPEVIHRPAAFGCEIGDGVDGFETVEESAGQRR